MSFEFASRVAGIPCIISVIEYSPGNSNYQYSDWDHDGYCEWEVLDRKGYTAPWLTKKLTASDSNRIFDEIEKYVSRSSWW